MSKVEPIGKCWCGCGATTRLGRFFLPYHDRKAEAALVKVEYGDIANMLAAHGYGPDKSVVGAKELLEK